MLDTTLDSLAQFFRSFRRTTPFPVEILLPGLLILFAWPLLRIWLDDARTTFMVAFVLGMGLRLVMKSQLLITRTRAQVSAPATVALILLAGPGVLALLIYHAEPLLCQRFLSLYFVFAAGLYTLDVIDGSYAINRFRWPQPEMRGTDAVMTRVMVIYNLGMVLANETLIHHASETTWLLYFGLLPLLSNMIRTALVRTVQDSYGA
ncbi:hypothetical protein GCM10010873_38540 [Cypionkella aquatica]|uniref:Uncharacterized protein n=1 Tax=Cypionkella aquatica TaxID=1756042 RepID=A0AA37X478_9RHOB|nr:hypothetical protein [Cypionkella aquatica]GLS88880.1 hypothetical protein GCM10010873_38540 [Cypionkella aquatica]